jgi:hypothetical protein
MKPWERYQSPQTEPQPSDVPPTGPRPSPTIPMDKPGPWTRYQANTDSPQLRPDDVFGGPMSLRGDLDGGRTTALRGALATAGGTMATFSDEGRKNIWSRQLETAGVPHEWRKDSEGFDVLVYQGPDGEMKSGYVNKPGNVALDLTSIIGQGAAFFGASMAARPLLQWGVPGMMGQTGGRALLAAGGGATQSVITDQGANQLGADLGIQEQAVNAGLSAAAAGVLQPVAELAAAQIPAAVRASTAAVRRWQQSLTGARAEYEQATRQLILETADTIQPGSSAILDDLPSDWWRNLSRSIEGVSDPNDAVAIAIDRAIRDEVPGFIPFRSQVTGSVADAQNLDQAARGRYGPAVQTEVQTQRQANQAALDRRAGDLQRELGGQGIESPAQAGAIIQEGLIGRSEMARDAVRQAYDAAAARPGSFVSDATAQLPGRIENALIGLDVKLPREPLAPQFQATRQISEQISRMMDGSPDLDLQQFERLRRYSGNLAQSAENPADRRAAQALVRELDDWADDMLNRGLYSGLPEDVEALKQARRVFRDYRQTFGQNPSRTATNRRDNDMAGKVIADIVEMDLNPVTVIDRLLGGGQLGLGPQSNAILDRLARAVGKDSTEWRALQEAGYMRLLYDHTGAMKKPQAVVNDWSRLKRDNGPWLQRLYGTEELKKIDRMVAVMGRLTPQKDAYVPSGPAIARLEDRLTQLAGTFRFPIVQRFVGDYVTGSGERAIARQGMQAITAPQPTYIPNANLRQALVDAQSGGIRAGARAGSDEGMDRLRQ